MKRIFRTLAPLAAALAFASPAMAQKAMPEGNPDADPTFMVESSDVKMNRAIAEAQETLPEWLAVLEHPGGNSDISFKFPLEGWEHIWVTEVSRHGDILHGYLANNPVAPGWALGDEVSVPLSDVSDWAYWDADGVAHGYRTVRVLFDEMSPEEVAHLLQTFGWND